LLVVAAINLASYVTREGSQGAGELVQAHQHLEEAIAAARSLSVELFPPVLHTSGLPAALGWLADWSRSKYGLAVTVFADPHADSPRKDVRTLLFESVRELLFNVVKHAAVEHVTVDLAVGPYQTLRITVTDAGHGFDATALDERARQSQGGLGVVQHPRTVTVAWRAVRHRECARPRGAVPLDRAPRRNGPRGRRPASGESGLSGLAHSSRCSQRVPVSAADSDRG
jgi:signal transduction histidine kinase